LANADFVAYDTSNGNIFSHDSKLDFELSSDSTFYSALAGKRLKICTTTNDITPKTTNISQIATSPYNMLDAQAEAEWKKVELTVNAWNKKLKDKSETLSKEEWIADYKASKTNITEVVKP
jgi:hypothetical protein